MTTLSAINFNTPFLQGVPNSRVSPEWIRLLGAVVSTVSSTGGASSASDIETFSYTARTSQNILYRLADIENQILRRQTPQAPHQDDLPIALRPATVAASNRALIVDDVTTNATVYPLFSNGTGGHRIVNSASSKWTFNPSTGAMSATQIIATGAFGCNGQAAQTSFALGGAATDLATVITLANNLRTMSINNGIGKN